MLQLKPLDEQVPIFQQLGAEVSPVVLVNVFQVAKEDIAALLEAWQADANWMKKQPGYISTQLHQGIAGSTVFLNYALWESSAHFRAAFNQEPVYGQAVIMCQRMQGNNSLSLLHTNTLLQVISYCQLRIGLL